MRGERGKSVEKLYETTYEVRKTIIHIISQKELDKKKTTGNS